MGFESIYKLSVVMNMIDNLSSPMRGATDNMNSSVSKIDGMTAAFGGLTQTGAALAGTGVQIMEGVLAPVKATFETKKAIGELSSLGVRDLGLVEDAAKSFSDTWAGTTKADFITAAYDIKSGIASLTDAGVAGYTELSGITATATKSSVTEMTDLFATGYGIYKDFYSDLSDIEFGEIFTGGIAKSVQQFKTTGSGMAQAIKTLGASATTAGAPLEEQLAVLGILQATMSGSEAGTKYKAFIRSAVKGGKELGLSFVDANNKMLSMPQILDQLRGKFGETMDAAEKMELQQAFGDTESVALIDLMYTKTGNLEDSILTLYDTMGQGKTAALDMANEINKTDSSKYELLKQKLDNVSQTIGNILSPTVNEYMGKASELLDKASDWISNHQELVRILMIAGAVLGSFLIVVGGGSAVIGLFGMIITRTIGFGMGLRRTVLLMKSGFETMQIRAMIAGDSVRAAFLKMKAGSMTAISGIKNVVTNILTFAKTAALNGMQAAQSFVLGIIGIGKQAIVTAVTAMPGLIASVWGFTTALLANPITWIVIAIIALIAGLVALWQNWDSVVAFIKGVWTGFVSGIVAGIDWIKEKFAVIGTFFGSIGENIKNAFVNGIEKIKTFITGVPQFFKESGKKIITTFVEGIKSMISKPAEIIKEGLQKVRNLLPFSDAKEGPLSSLTLSGNKVLSTMSEGIEQSENLPADAVEKSLSKVDLSVASAERAPIKKININGNQQKTQESGVTSKNTGNIERKLIIQHLNIPVDLKRISDIKKLLKLLEEIEDYQNRNNDDNDENLVPVMA